MRQTLKWWSAQLTVGRPRWREQKNIYNQRDLTKGGTVIRKTPGSSIGGVSKEKKKRPEDGLWPSPQLRRWRSCSPRIMPDRWRSPHKGLVLKPASLPNSLYWTRLVWVRSHLQWKAPPQIGTLRLVYLVKGETKTRWHSLKIDRASPILLLFHCSNLTDTSD